MSNRLHALIAQLEEQIVAGSEASPPSIEEEQLTALRKIAIWSIELRIVTHEEAELALDLLEKLRADRATISETLAVSSFLVRLGEEVSTIQGVEQIPDPWTSRVLALTQEISQRATQQELMSWLTSLLPMLKRAILRELRKFPLYEHELCICLAQAQEHWDRDERELLGRQLLALEDPTGQCAYDVMRYAPELSEEGWTKFAAANPRDVMVIMALDLPSRWVRRQAWQLLKTRTLEPFWWRVILKKHPAFRDRARRHLRRLMK